MTVWRARQRRKAGIPPDPFPRSILMTSSRQSLRGCPQQVARVGLVEFGERHDRWTNGQHYTAADRRPTDQVSTWRAGRGKLELHGTRVSSRGTTQGTTQGCLSRVSGDFHVHLATRLPDRSAGGLLFEGCPLLEQPLGYNKRTTSGFGLDT